LAPHPIFDVAWYRLKNRGSLNNIFTDLEHFIFFGQKRGSTPSPIFDYEWYLKQLSGKILSRGAAFRHYLKEGAIEQISPSPLFDSRYYLKQNKDLNGKSINPLTHFAACGVSSGKDPNPFFSSAWYLRQHLSEMADFKNPLAHFIAVGAEQGFDPHPAINLDLFRAQEPTASDSRLDSYIRLVTGHGDDTARKLIIAHMRRYRRGNGNSSRQDRPRPIAFALDLSGFSGLVGKQDLAPGIPPPHVLQPSHSITNTIQLFTLDIWDTVLRRNCYPDEIKLQFARFFYLRAFPDIKYAYRDVRTLFQARITSENLSADNDEFEYRFEDAVDRFLDTVLVGGIPLEKIAAIRVDVIEHEFRSESESTRLDETMRYYLQNLRAPAMFVSDFYTSSRFISDLLDYHGALGWFVKGYVSSDTFETKRGGALFNRVLSETCVPPTNILHIGDNIHADVLKPREKGITAYHYHSDGEVDRRNWYGEAFYAWRRDDNTLHERRIMALCENLAGAIECDDAESELRCIGVRLAPLAISYVLSIIESAIRENVPTVHYFTREGLFFKDLHDAIVDANPYRTTYPDAQILHVSRRATFAASLESVTPKELMRLWSQYSIQSLEGLATSLNLDVQAVGAMAAKAGLDAGAPVKYPWQDTAFIKFLASEPFQSLAERSRLQQRKGLLAYLATKGITSPSTLKIADIGWRGTIQDNIAKILPATFVTGHYLGLHNYLNRQDFNVSKAGWVFDEPCGRAAQVGDLAPIEMIFNGPGGSVIGYDISPEGVQPRTDVIPGEEAIVLGPVAALQQGILAAVPACLNYVQAHGLMAEDLRNLASRLCASLSQNPPAAVASVFQQLDHNESFGFGAVDSVSATSTLAEALNLSAESSEIHAAVTAALSRERWVEGAIRASEMSKWWDRASPARKACVPIVISSQFSPAIIKARGSNLLVFVPPPIRASGGHRTIFNMVRRLAKLGFNPEIFLESRGDGVEIVEEYLSGTRAMIHTEWHSFIPSQVAFATVAHSAMYVSRLSNCNHRAYLVQDFEAMFNPMSDGYIVGENSFTQGLQHFTIGNWLSHVIHSTFGAAASPAGLGVDTAIYHRLDVDDDPASGLLRGGRKPVASASLAAMRKLAAPKIRRETAVCFLYQPDKPRRMPSLGIDALRLVKQAMPECTIYVYGSNIPLHLDFEVTNLGLITDLSELNRLYNRCIAGLCISGSNPSRIPYEMMAAGCVPVDLYRYNNLLDHKSGTVLLSFQNPHSLSKAILSLLNDAKSTALISRKASKFVSTRTLDWEMDVIANNVLAMMDDQLSGTPELDLIYDAAPIISLDKDVKEDLKSIKGFCASQYALAARP